MSSLRVYPSGAAVAPECSNASSHSNCSRNVQNPQPQKTNMMATKAVLNATSGSGGNATYQESTCSLQFCKSSALHDMPDLHPFFLLRVARSVHEDEEHRVRFPVKQSWMSASFEDKIVEQAFTFSMWTSYFRSQQIVLLIVALFPVLQYALSISDAIDRGIPAMILSFAVIFFHYKVMGRYRSMERSRVAAISKCDYQFVESMSDTKICPLITFWLPFATVLALMQIPIGTFFQALLYCTHWDQIDAKDSFCQSPLGPGLNSRNPMAIGTATSFIMAALFMIRWPMLVVVVFVSILVLPLSLPIVLLINTPVEAHGTWGPEYFSFCVFALAVFLAVLTAARWNHMNLRRQFAAALSLKLQMAQAQKAHLETSELRIQAAQQATTKMVQERTIGYASHQLRNPLHGITNLTQSLIDRGVVQGEDLRDLHSILAACEHMKRVTSDVLDHHKLMNGSIKLAPRRTQILHVCTAAVERVQARLYHRGDVPEVVIHLMTCVPENVEVDDLRLSQILSQAVDNALKHCAPGQRVVLRFGCVENPMMNSSIKPGTRSRTQSAGHCQQPRIPDESVSLVSDTEFAFVPAWADNDVFERGQVVCLCFEIENIGHGLSRPASQLFDTSAMTENNKFVRVQGAGLGLPICKLLTDKMGGHIFLYDQPLDHPLTRTSFSRSNSTLPAPGVSHGLQTLSPANVGVHAHSISFCEDAQLQTPPPDLTAAVNPSQFRIVPRMAHSTPGLQHLFSTTDSAASHHIHASTIETKPVLVCTTFCVVLPVCAASRRVLHPMQAATSHEVVNESFQVSPGISRRPVALQSAAMAAHSGENQAHYGLSLKVKTKTTSSSLQGHAFAENNVVSETSELPPRFVDKLSTDAAAAGSDNSLPSVQSLSSVRTVEDKPGVKRMTAFAPANIRDSFVRSLSRHSSLDMLQPKRALIVDDEKINRRVLSRLLQQFGIQTHCLNDGEAVLPWLQSKANPSGVTSADSRDPNHCKCDIIFMDIIMKRMNGDIACKQLREAGFTVPVIAATGNTSIADLEQYTNVGFNAILCKPFGREDLIRVMHEVTTDEDVAEME